MKDQIKDSQLHELYDKLVNRITDLGYPEEFGTLIAMSLGTEKTMARMLSYINRVHPQSAEEIADEMLSIKAEFSRYREKKIAEFYNKKLNRLMEEGLEPEDFDVGESREPE